MSNSRGQKVVFDVIHGNIELTRLESILLSSPTINRLHQILQNSTAYLTYPNMKSSRFEHSLGAMKYAGELFRNGIINSLSSSEYLSESKEELVKANTLEEIEKIAIRELSADDVVNYRLSIDHLGGYQAIFESDELREYLIKMFGEGFYLRHYSQSDVRLTSTEIVLHQAFRIFALLHDVGHLPLSHLFERALGNIHSGLESVDEGDENSDSLTSALRRIISATVEQSAKIHEMVGKKVSLYVFQELRKKLLMFPSEQTFDEKAIANVALSCVQFIWQEIAKRKEGKFFELNLLVDGVIDCDRLDFVQRDGKNSGIAPYPANVDRVVRMHCLTVDPDNSISKYRFLPAIQSLNDVNEILYHRFRCYKHVFNHHSVKRSDSLYQKLIELLLASELEAEEHKRKARTNLAELIRTIDKIIREAGTVANSISENVLKFTSLTDSWLFSELNGFFISRWGHSENLEDRIANDLFQNKKSFKTIWKRSNEYSEFLCELGELVVADRNKMLSESYDKGSGLMNDLVSLLNDGQVDRRRGELIEIGDLIVAFIREKCDGWISNLETSIRKKYEIDILICPTLISHGIMPFSLVDTNNQSVLLPYSQLSTKENEFNISLKAFAQFFVYCAVSAERSVSVKTWRSRLAKEMVDLFFSRVNELKINTNDKST